jgi:hypothetical protein
VHRGRETLRDLLKLIEQSLPGIFASAGVPPVAFGLEQRPI